MRGSIKGGAGNRWDFFSVRNVAEKFAFRGSLPLVKCVAVWALKLPVPHTDALKTHFTQNFSATLLQCLKDSWKSLPREIQFWHKYTKTAPGYLAERDDSMADLENMLSGTGKNLRGVSANTQVSDLRSLQIDTSARLS